MRHPIPLLIAALLLTMTAQAGTPIDETRPMSPDGLVDLDLTNAIVRITGNDSDEFHIVGELGDLVDEYDLRASNGNIRFEEEWRRGSDGSWWNWGNDRGRRRCSFDSEDDCEGRFSRLEISLPRGAVLRVDGVNGDVVVSGMTNSTNITVVNASLLLSDLRGVVKAETVNGDIDAEILQGRVSLETVNGEITDNGSSADRVEYSTVNGDIASDVRSADISAEVVNGDIELMLETVSDLHLSSVGGRIEVDAALADDADVEISTVHGRVSLRVPETTSARFLIKTEVSGRISNELSDDEPERRSRYVNARDLSFSLNGGDADVEITSVSGNIALRRR